MKRMQGDLKAERKRKRMRGSEDVRDKVIRKQAAPPPPGTDSESSFESDDSDAKRANGSLMLFKKRPSQKIQVDQILAKASVAEQDFSGENDSGESDNSWTFESLGLSPWLVTTCKKLGMHEPTAVQRKCIPPTLKGLNIVGGSPTGSGKTAAFALPILNDLAKDMYGVFAIVLTPTRELAFQIGEQFHAFGTPIRLKCEVIVGGMSQIEQQLKLSKRPHIIVATPGRLIEHLSGPVPPKVDHAKYVVLDEADRLLEPSFAHDLGILFQKTPSSRQTLLYSATMTDAITTVTKASKKRVFEYHATPVATTPDQLDERYLLIPHQIKIVYLTYLLRRLGPQDIGGLLAPASYKQAKHGKRKKIDRIIQDRIDAQEEQALDDDQDDSGDRSDDDDALDFDRAGLIIVFTSSCKNCQLVGEALAQLGVNCSVLHGRLTQNRRLAALGKFRSGVTKVLVATDVASRGLDIPQVDLVVNFDVPHATEDYIHRVGRTARAGRKGLAVTLISQYDVDLVHAIEAVTKVKLRLLPGVSEDKDVLVLLTRVQNAVRAARLQIAETSADEPNRNRKRNNWKK